MHKKIMKIGFLFGSGLSLKAGYPSTSKITENVISGKNVFRHTDGNYYFGQSPMSHTGFPEEYLSRILIFLNRVKVESDLYYFPFPDRSTNYEDLYYICNQINDSESFNYDNPIVQSFVDKILPDIKSLFDKRRSEIKGTWNLLDLTSEAMNYIVDTAWHLLNKDVAEINYLSFLKQCYDKDDYSNIYIFTLNHDTLLEQYFSSNTISIQDGFSEPINDVRYWDQKLFNESKERISLIKLHGSVNWFRYNPEENPQTVQIGIPLEWDFWHTTNPKGELQYPIDGRPMFLAGTFNKMLHYNYGIWYTLQRYFYEVLNNDLDLIIVCGYSFSDKGINTRLIEWMDGNSQNRILIIHPDLYNLKVSARGAIARNWDAWKKDNRLITIQNNIENVDWDTIERGLQ